MTRRYSAVYVRAGDWWAASVQEVPGVHSQGRTLNEARENLRDALEGLLEIAGVPFDSARRLASAI